MKRFLLPLVMLFVTAVALVLAGTALLRPGAPTPVLPATPDPLAGLGGPLPGSAAQRDGVYVGEVVSPPVRVRDFSAPASTGETVAFSALAGRWRVVFFGYLHCPDFCPLTLAEYRRVKQMLGAEADQVEFVYISVDAVRDTPETMRAYLNNFDPDFIGLSADDATLAAIQPDFGFYYRRRFEGEGSAARMIVDHSTRSYLIDPSGRLVATFTYNTDPAVVTEAIRWHLENS